jgi:hypothetical protein
MRIGVASVSQRETLRSDLFYEQFSDGNLSPHAIRVVIWWETTFDISRPGGGYLYLPSERTEGRGESCCVHA